MITIVWVTPCTLVFAQLSNELPFNYLTDILQIDACRIRFDGHRSERMEQALIDRYRCPESLVKFDLIGGLSKEAGYFRFGQDTICYGHSATGFRASRADGVLYDVLKDVTTNGSNARSAI